MFKRGQEVFAKASHQVEGHCVAASNPLRQGFLASALHEDRWPTRDCGLGDETHDVLMVVQSTEYLGLGPNAVSMRGIDCDLKDQSLLGIVASNEQRVSATATPEAIDHGEVAIEHI